MQSEIKKNIQGTNSEEKETGFKSTIWNIRKQKNNLSEQEEEKKDPKEQNRVSSLWDNVKHSNIRMIGVPEGERDREKIGNLFEKVVKANFPNLVKE